MLEVKNVCVVNLVPVKNSIQESHLGEGVGTDGLHTWGYT